MLTTSRSRRIAATRAATKYLMLSLTKLPALLGNDSALAWAGATSATASAKRGRTRAERERITPKLPHPALEFALDFAAHVAVRDLAPAVAPLLAPGQGQLDLRPRALKVNPQRDQRQPFLRGLAD